MGFSPTWDPTAIVVWMGGAIILLSGILVRIRAKEFHASIVRVVKDWVIDSVKEARKDIFDLRMANGKKLAGDPALGGAQLAMDALRRRIDPRGRDKRKPE